LRSIKKFDGSDRIPARRLPSDPVRIISGSAKGTRLGRVPPGTRPLSDRAREGLFSSLGDHVVDATCADLYAGTGAVGIEALSRGAASCLFVDSSPAAVRAVEENLGRAGLEERGLVVRTPVPLALRRERGEFDLLFLDPPYDIPEEELREALALAADRLATNGAFVLTRPKRRDSTDVIPLQFRATKLLSYGDARILVCRRQP
jgi:16S rRNA (guanine966-N2)-methyltransferase